MDATEFALLQEALMWVLGPLAMWMATLTLASAFLAAIFVVWMMMLRKITSGR